MRHLDHADRIVLELKRDITVTQRADTIRIANVRMQ